MATAEDVIGDAEKQTAHDMHRVQNTGLQWITTNISGKRFSGGLMT